MCIYNNTHCWFALLLLLLLLIYFLFILIRKCERTNKTIGNGNGSKSVMERERERKIEKKKEILWTCIAAWYIDISNLFSCTVRARRVWNSNSNSHRNNNIIGRDKTSEKPMTAKSIFNQWTSYLWFESTC